MPCSIILFYSGVFCHNFHSRTPGTQCPPLKEGKTIFKDKKQKLKNYITVVMVKQQIVINKSSCDAEEKSAPILGGLCSSMLLPKIMKMLMAFGKTGQSDFPESVPFFVLCQAHASIKISNKWSKLLGQATSND